MNATIPGNNLETRLVNITSRWWVYLILMMLFFLPPYVANGYAPDETAKLIEETLRNSFILAARATMPFAKLIPILLFVTLYFVSNRFGRIISAYVALVYLAISLFQNATWSDHYGLIVLTGNVALILVTALAWIWELFIQKNDYHWRNLPLWRWWVLPLALLALLNPVDPKALSPSLDIRNLVTNEAGIIYCMFTPWVLAVMTLSFPQVNIPMMRVTSFIGILFGLVNLIMWFGINPWGWWMGVLHIPLFSISLYAFILSARGTKRALTIIGN